MAGLGFRPEDFEGDDDSSIWPENLQAYLLFDYMSTQWRIGFRGASGLDYSVLQHKMDRMNLTPEAYQALENDIRIMEDEALAAIHSN